MVLGTVGYVELRKDTKTTKLIDQLGKSNNIGDVDTLCVDPNMFVYYKENEDRYNLYKVCLYLTDNNFCGDAVARYNAGTFTDLKTRYTNKTFDVMGKYDETHDQFRWALCDLIKNKLDIVSGESIDVAFPYPLRLYAQGDWLHRGWGHASTYYIIGIKLKRKFN